MQLRRLPCLLIAVAGFAASAAAQQAPAPQPISQTCKSELASLCSATAKGGEGLRCLTQNQDKLGTECATAVKAVQARREQLRATCQADADKLCKDVAAKGNQLVQCLRGKTAELSKPCADAIAALPQRRAQ